jgi:hypothetical protein
MCTTLQTAEQRSTIQTQFAQLDRKIRILLLKEPSDLERIESRSFKVWGLRTLKVYLRRALTEVMNITESKSVSIHSALQEASKLFQSIPSMDYPHILVVALFILVLHARTTYLPVSIPAFLLSAYREWSLRAEGGVSTIKYSLSSILVCWLGTFAYRLLKRRLLLHSMVSSLSFFVPDATSR